MKKYKLQKLGNLFFTTGLYPKGLLGMDFLKKAKAIIDTFQGEIEIHV